jgi:hypothetical protein
MTEITLDKLEKLKIAYEQNEWRARDLAKAEQNLEFKTAYLFQATKARGMKEAVEELIFVLTGTFPEMK